MQKLRNKISSYWQLAKNTDNGDLAKIVRPENIEEKLLGFRNMQEKLEKAFCLKIVQIFLLSK